MSRQISDLDPILSPDLEISDLLAIEDVDVPRTKKVTLADLAVKLLDIQTPIGSLYFNGDNPDNPATYLGFGTWTKHAQGRAITGQSTTDSDFGTGGQTGGAKTHTLTTAQMPAHNHSGSTSGAGGHNHSIPINISTGTGAGGDIRGVNQTTNGNANNPTGSVGDHAHSVSTNNVGGGEAHNNMSPYIVVYVWKRTG